MYGPVAVSVMACVVDRPPDRADPVSFSYDAFPLQSSFIHTPDRTSSVAGLHLPGFSGPLRGITWSCLARAGGGAPVRHAVHRFSRPLDGSPLPPAPWIYFIPQPRPGFLWTPMRAGEPFADRQTSGIPSRDRARASFLSCSHSLSRQKCAVRKTPRGRAAAWPLCTRSPIADCAAAQAIRRPVPASQSLQSARAGADGCRP